MNIGILSMQKVINFGSVLQAYSLQKMLQECGEYNISFIDIDWSGQIPTHMPIADGDDYDSEPYFDFPKAVFYLKKVINKFCEKKIKKEIKQFQFNELKLNEHIDTEPYDLVIVGSDEVFMAKKRLCPQLYGRIKNAKHIVSYAASCGSAVFEGLPVERISDIRKYLSNFESMSVRDYHTLDYISKLYDKDIKMHLDPVLVGPLYKKQHSRVLSKEYLLVYAYGDRIRTKKEIRTIKEFAKEKNLLIIAVGAPQYWADKSIACSPLDLMDYFFYANCVVTDTFHGAVFSIINNKNFCVFGRKSNKFKLDGLLDVMDLKKCIVTNKRTLSQILEQPIDYTIINAMIEKERERTYSYLKGVLELCD